jgi:hypothetical protein
MLRFFPARGAGAISISSFLRGPTGATGAAGTAGFDEIVFVIDGGGILLTTGLKGVIPIEFDCTITKAEMLIDQSGSIVVDILKCTYALYDAAATHPVIGDKINASAPPTIASATKSADTTLTGWTTAITAGDILGFFVSSASTVTRATVMLKVSR